jgi:hypothetical protein
MKMAGADPCMSAVVRPREKRTQSIPSRLDSPGKTNPIASLTARPDEPNLIPGRPGKTNPIDHWDGSATRNDVIIPSVQIEANCGPLPRHREHLPVEVTRHREGVISRTDSIH